MSWMRRHGSWVVAGLLACGLGSVAIARLELSRLRDAFDTDMRIAHPHGAAPPVTATFTMQAVDADEDGKIANNSREVVIR